MSGSIDSAQKSFDKIAQDITQKAGQDNQLQVPKPSDILAMQKATESHNIGMSLYADVLQSDFYKKSKKVSNHSQTIGERILNATQSEMKNYESAKTDIEKLSRTDLTNPSNIIQLQAAVATWSISASVAAGAGSQASSAIKTLFNSQ